MATSDRVSRIAGRVLASLRPWPARAPIYVLGVRLTVGDVRALAASCLAQDETRGPRKSKRKARK